MAAPGQVGEAIYLVRAEHDPRSARTAGSKVVRDAAAGAKGESGLFRRVGSDLMAGFGIGLGAGFVATVAPRIADFVGDLGRMGAPLEQMDRKASVVFGDSLRRVQEWSDGTAHSFGLTRRELVDLGAGMADVLVPLGFLREEAAGLTIDALDVAGAVAEWSAGKFTATDVAGRFTKALTGEREGLKELGIVISEADVKARVLTNAQEGLTFETEAQAKAVATLQLITENSTDAQAAFAEGADSAARKQAEASARWKEGKEALAEELLPAVTAVTEGLAGLAGGFATGVQFARDYKTEMLAVGAAALAIQGARQLGGLSGMLDTLRLRTMFAGDALRRWDRLAIQPASVGLGALGIAVFEVTRRIRDASERKRQFEQRTRDVADAIFDETGALNVGTDAWARYMAELSRFGERNQIDDFERLGFTTQQVTDLMLDGEAGLRAFVTRAIEVGEVSLGAADSVDSAADMLLGFKDASAITADGILSDNADLVTSFAQEQRAVEASSRAKLDALAVNDTLTPAERRLAAELAAAADAGGNLNWIMGEAAPLLDKVDSAAADAAGSTDDLAGSTGDAADAGGDLLGTGDSLVDTYETLADVLAGVDDLMANLFDTQQDVDKSTADLEAAYDDLRQSVFETGGGFDETTASGRQNMAAARDLGSAVRDLTTAELANGDSLLVVMGRQEQRIETLRRELAAMGLNEQQIEDIIEVYGRVPEDVATAMHVEAEAATANANNYRANVLGSIPSSVWTTAIVDTTQANAAIEALRAQMAALGSINIQDTPGGTGLNTRSLTPEEQFRRSLAQRGFARAAGGPVQANVAYLVGEDGPELLTDIPWRRGHVWSNDQLAESAAASGGAVTIGAVNVTVTGVLDPANPSAAMDLARVITDAVGQATGAVS